MSAALAFISLAVEQYGERLQKNLVRVPLSQAALAAEFGCSAGTIANYVRQLRPAVLASTGCLIVDSGALALGSRIRDIRGVAVPRPPDAPTSGIVAGQPHLGVADPRPPDTQLASFSVSRDQKLASYSAPKAADPRRTTTRRERLSEDPAIDVALAPLVAYARRCSPPLPTALNDEGRRWLGLYSPAELSHAAANVMARLKGAGKPVRSPIGLMVSMARQGDECFSPPAPALPVAKPDVVAVGVDQVPAGPEAIDVPRLDARLVDVGRSQVGGCRGILRQKAAAS